MKKYIFTFCGILGIIVFCAYRSGAPGAATCAPGETSCATSGLCHGGIPDSGPGFADITVMGGVPVNGYNPGQTYALMPYLISNDGKTTLGFQTVAKLRSNGNPAGTVSITDPYKTQKFVYGGFEYTTHTDAGTYYPGMHDWMYNWTAPPAGSGTVVIYGAFLAANDNNASSGDLVYTDSLVLPEYTAGIDELKAYPFSLFPNPVKESLTIRLTDRNDKVISIYSSTGQLVHQSLETSDLVTIPVTTLPAGLYMIEIVSQGRRGVEHFCKL